MDMLFAFIYSSIPDVILSGFVIFGFNSIKFPKPLKVLLLLVALTTLAMEFLPVLLLVTVKEAPLVVLSGFLLFGIKYIELPKPAKILLFLFSMLVFGLSLFGWLMATAFLIPH